MSTLDRVAKPNMVMRSIRVPEKLWDAAKARADEREENLSDAIRRFLEEYGTMESALCDRCHKAPAEVKVEHVPFYVCRPCGAVMRAGAAR